MGKKYINQLAGPVGIISMTSSSATEGIKVLLIILVVISVNLAVLNLIPLPIFDGGQILFYSIEALIGRPLPSKVREYIHIGSWLLILILMVYLTANDIIRLAGLQYYIDLAKEYLLSWRS